MRNVLLTVACLVVLLLTHHGAFQAGCDEGFADGICWPEGAPLPQNLDPPNIELPPGVYPIGDFHEVWQPMDIDEAFSQPDEPLRSMFENDAWPEPTPELKRLPPVEDEPAPKRQQGIGEVNVATLC